VFPPWAAIYSLSTVQQKNEKGQWWGWKIDRVGVNRLALLVEQAKTFHQSIRSGAIKIDRAAMEPDGEDNSAQTEDGM